MGECQEQKKARKHVVIVGCGFTGTTSFHQLVHNYPVRKVTIFESAGKFGPGFPYQPSESTDYLINNTNDTMCLDPSNRQAFVEWLRVHDKHSLNLDEKGHLPRAVYGEFLSEVVDQTVMAAEKRGIEVDLLKYECQDIEENSDNTVTVHHTGGSTTADMVILATGRCPEHDAFGLTASAENTYFQSHTPASRFDDLPLDAEVHVLGCSLSAFDVVNKLFSPSTGCRFVNDGENRMRFVAKRNSRQIVLCSRSGRMKKVQSRNPLPIRREHFTAKTIGDFDKRSVTLKQIYDLMAKDAELAGVDIDLAAVLNPYSGCKSQDDINARAAEILENDVDAAAAEQTHANFVVDYLDHAQFDIWDLFASQRLSSQQEALFRSDVESAYLSVAAPCPSPTAQRVLALIHSGNLRIVRGVRSVTAQSEGNGFEIQHGLGTDVSRFLINATGIVDRDVRSSSQSTLIRNMVRRDLLRPYEVGSGYAPGAAVDMSTFRCSGARNVYAANMFLWGPGIYVSAAIIMANIVRQLLAAAFKPG